MNSVFMDWLGTTIVLSLVSMLIGFLGWVAYTMVAPFLLLILAGIVAVSGVIAWAAL